VVSNVYLVFRPCGDYLASTLPEQLAMVPNGRFSLPCALKSPHKKAAALQINVIATNHTARLMFDEFGAVVTRECDPHARLAAFRNGILALSWIPALPANSGIPVPVWQFEVAGIGM
jgi:hypothetical protein